MYYCVFFNHTTANRVKNMVDNDLNYVAITQAPKAISGSCSYALKFDDAKLNQIKNVIEKNQFRFKGIYKEIVLENGEKQYRQI